jgi:hypothetical protein
MAAAVAVAGVRGRTLAEEPHDVARAAAGGEVDEARAEAGVGGDHHLGRKAPRPALRRQRMHLAGRVEPQQRDVARHQWRRLPRVIRFAPHLLAGGLEDGRFGMTPDSRSAGPSLLQDEVQRRLGVRMGGAARGVHQRRGLAQVGDAEVRAGLGHLGEAGGPRWCRR